MSAAEIEALLDKAETLVATRNVVRALEIYERIYVATGATKHLYNIGYLYEDMGELDRAWDYYQRFLLEWPQAPNAKELQGYLEELAEELGRTHVLVHAFTTPPGASIEIVTRSDSRRPFGVTPLSTWMPLGKVLLRLNLDGHEALEKKVVVKRRRSQRLKFKMKAVPKPGILICGEIPEGATLSVDDTHRPDAITGAKLSLEPGKHQLSLTLSDGTVRRATVAVADGVVEGIPGAWWPNRADDAAAHLNEPEVNLVGATVSLELPVGVWVTGSVALVTAVSAGVVLGLAHDSASQAQGSLALLTQHHNAGQKADADQEHAIWSSLSEDADSLESISIALFTVAGAAAIGSVVWWLLDGSSPPSADAAFVTPLIFDDGLGAAATLRF
jgi:hypothetical protein